MEQSASVGYNTPMRHAAWASIATLLWGCGGKIRDNSGASPGTAGATQDGVQTSNSGSAGGTMSTLDSGTTANECVPSLNNEPRELPVFGNFDLLVESSSRMAAASDGGMSAWDSVRDGLSEFVELPGAATDFTVGLQFFPPEGGPFDSCPAANDGLDVQVSTLPGIAPSIVDRLYARLPAGLAPTGPALQGAIDNMRLVAANGMPIVVLITVGPPTECAPLDVSGLTTIAANALSSTPSVRTAVIGIGADLDAFNDVAQAGGTSHAYLISDGDVRAQLVDALFTIAGRNVPCTLSLPPGTVDYGLIAVQQSSFDYSHAHEIPKVTDPSACGLADDLGWFFDDPLAPTTLNLCSRSCWDVQGGSLSLLLGCPPKTAP